DRSSSVSGDAVTPGLARRTSRSSAPLKRGGPLGGRPGRSRGRVTPSRASGKRVPESSFSVGIDLGTTNCAIARADLASDAISIDVVPVPQLVEPGEVASPTLLPSFLYVVGEFDFPAGSLKLPWDDPSAALLPPHIVGELARKRGGENPSRLVSSAKSWL